MEGNGMCTARKVKGGYKVTGVKKTFTSKKTAKAKVRQVSGAIHARQAAARKK